MAGTLSSFLVAREWRGCAYLISPFFDFMLAGGFAALVLASLFVIYPPDAPLLSTYYLQVGAVMAIIAYLVNDPHFIVSYQLLYRGYTEKLRAFRAHRELWIRYVIAGIVAPLILVLYFSYGLLTQRADIFVWGIQAMLIILGWHYVKQAFGVFVMLSALQKIYYTGWQRALLLGNCYVVWICYTANLFAHRAFLPVGDLSVSDFWGVGSVTFPHLLLWQGFPTLLAWLIIGSEIAAAGAMLYGNKRLPFSAFIGYFSMYFLLFASAYHPLWLLMAPAFHSLQYLMFIYAYKRGETVQQIASKQRPRRQVIFRLAGFILIAVLLGLVFMEPVPTLMENWLNPDQTLFFPLAAAFIVTINIQHYFIDNVLWRKENTDVGEYLFHRS